ncbi:MAG TPA: alpha/beta hydrolase [Bryobacteraceae bacterium]|nr:alpha/beta hydrolase [Bryobacteraceae bacterium]
MTSVSTPRRPDSEQPELRILPVNGIEIAVWDWPGPGDAAPLLFSHGNSFHGRCWDQIIRAFPDRRCLAAEHRGHGRSTKVAPPCRWRDFGEDLAAVSEGLELQYAIGVGHSLGGYATTLAAFLRPETYAALILVDPTIRAPERHTLEPLDVSFVLRRRVRWESAAAMFERFRGRPPFDTWRPEILRDYCEFALLRDGEGLFLACPPAFEASIYSLSTAPETDISREIAAVGQRVVVMRGGPPQKAAVWDPRASHADPELASRFRCGRDVHLPHESHYLPMESPERVISEIGGVISSVSRGSA